MTPKMWRVVEYDNRKVAITSGYFFTRDDAERAKEDGFRFTESAETEIKIEPVPVNIPMANWVDLVASMLISEGLSKVAAEGMHAWSRKELKKYGLITAKEIEAVASAMLKRYEVASASLVFKSGGMDSYFVINFR